MGRGSKESRRGKPGVMAAALARCVSKVHSPPLSVSLLPVGSSACRPSRTASLSTLGAGTEKSSFQ